MTRSHVLVPSAGTIKLATNQYTDGANVKDDEVTILGEQHLPTYAMDPGAAANTTTTLKHLFQIMAGASLNVYVRWIGVYISTLAGAATNLPISLVRLTTAGTGGTAGAWSAYDTTDSAAGATNMVMPTALGTVSAALLGGNIIVPAAVPAVPGPKGLLLWEWPPLEASRAKTIRIPAGTANGIALRNNAALATATYNIYAVISEAAY